MDSRIEELELKENREAKQKQIWVNLNVYSIYLISAIFSGLALAAKKGFVNDATGVAIIGALVILMLFGRFMYKRSSEKLIKTRKEMSEAFKIKADVITRDYLVGLKETVDYAQKAKEPAETEVRTIRLYQRVSPARLLSHPTTHPRKVAAPVVLRRSETICKPHYETMGR